jgi:diguanylate cyclase (GGDEF)-like protein
MKIIERLEMRSKYFWVAAGLILIVGIGIIDYLTGYEISFSLFYLIPITLIAWFAGRRFGMIASIISASILLLAEYLARQPYSHTAIYFWNSTVRAGFFIIVTLLLARLNETLKREKVLSSHDFLTGAVNTRQFTKILQSEIDRSQRYQHSFTLVYIDIDNFKTINDQFGHSVGDRVLSTVVDYAKGLLRKTDTVVRLGGDEFAFLMPETDQNAAAAVISRVRRGLLYEMENKNWLVTFSMGALTFLDMPGSADEAIKLADDLMYSVKNNTKDAVKYSVYKK